MQRPLTLLVTMLLAVNSQTVPDVSRCPTMLQTSSIHYSRTFGEHCFQLVTFHPRTWDDAQRDCSSHGGQLVQVPDQATQDFLSRALEELHSREESVAIGLSDAAHEGDWRWTNGEKAGYTNWQDGQPEHSFLANIEDCVTMERSKGYKWADDTCHFLKKFAYICQFDMTPLITTPSTTTKTTLPSTQSSRPVTTSAAPTEKPLTTPSPKQTTTTSVDSTPSELTSRLPDKVTQTSSPSSTTAKTTEGTTAAVTTTATMTSKGTTKMTMTKFLPTSANSTTTRPTTVESSTSTTTTVKSSTETTRASTASTRVSASLPALTTILVKSSTTKTSAPLVQTSPSATLDPSPKSSPGGFGAATASSSNPSSAKSSQMPSSSASTAVAASTTRVLSTAASSSNPGTEPPSSGSSRTTAPQTTQTTTVATTTEPTTQPARTYPAWCGDFVCSLDCSSRGGFQVDVDGCRICSCNS